MTRLTVERAAGRQALRWMPGWPVVLRPTGGDERVHLVHAAGGPLGGDDLALSVDVGPGARLAVHSAGATLVQPGAATDAPARWTVELQVGASARVHWAPEPTVVSDGAGWSRRCGSCWPRAPWPPCGRSSCSAGTGSAAAATRGTTHVAVDGVPLLAHTTLLDGADPSLCGPAGTGGARAVGTLVRAGADVATTLSGRRGETPDVRWAWSALDGPGEVLMAVGTPSAVAAVLDAEGRGAAGAEDRVPRDGRGRAGLPGPGAGRPVSRARPLVGGNQRCRTAPYTRSNASVSTTRRSATIAARYSGQSGCSPASRR